MNYKGKLYGTIDGRKFFSLEMTSEEVDTIIAARDRLNDAANDLLSELRGDRSFRDYHMRTAGLRSATKGDDDDAKRND